MKVAGVPRSEDISPRFLLTMITMISVLLLLPCFCSSPSTFKLTCDKVQICSGECWNEYETPFEFQWSMKFWWNARRKKTDVSPSNSCCLRNRCSGEILTVVQTRGSHFYQVHVYNSFSWAFYRRFLICPTPSIFYFNDSYKLASLKYSWSVMHSYNMHSYGLCIRNCYPLINYRYVIYIDIFALNLKINFLCVYICLYYIYIFWLYFLQSWPTNAAIQKRPGDNLRLRCKVGGNPAPRLFWLKVRTPD